MGGRECIQLCLDEHDERVKSLWARIKGQSRKSDAVVGMCYRLPDQGEEVDEAFCRQLEASLKVTGPGSCGGILSTLTSAGEAVQQCQAVWEVPGKH